MKMENQKDYFIQIKNRDEGQLLNYKKFLSIPTKNRLNDTQKYLLAIRDIDPTQQEDSVSVGQIYRDQFGKIGCYQIVQMNFYSNKLSSGKYLNVINLKKFKK